MNRLGRVVVLLGAILSAACSDDDGCQLSGRLTYLGTGGFDLTGHAYELRLDDDTDAGNGAVRTFSDTWGGGTTHNYAFDVSASEPGSYYLYAELAEPGTYLIYGWYNTNPTQPFNPRDLVEVRCGSVYSFDVDAT